MSDNKTKAKPKDEILPMQKQKVGEEYGPSPILGLLKELQELLDDKEEYPLG
jgi:hypothetical protein